MNRAFRGQLSEIGITTAQYTALRCLYENKGLNQTSLAYLMSTNKNNCSALIKRLFAQRLVAKNTTPSDRRNLTLTLTKEGESLFMQAEGIATDLQQEVMGILPVDTEQKLVALIEKCTENITSEN
jgi:DNA-binding MarR family transcriptional regulator